METCFSINMMKKCSLLFAWPVRVTVSNSLLHGLMVQGRMTSAETVPRNQQFSHLEVGHVESRSGLGFGSGPFLSKLIKIFSRFSAKLFG